MNIQKDLKKRYLKIMHTAMAERWNGISNKKDFAESIGITAQQLYHIETEKNRNVTVQMIFALCSAYDVNANHLILGSLPVRNSKLDSDEKLLKIQRIING